MVYMAARDVLHSDLHSLTLLVVFVVANRQHPRAADHAMGAVAARSFRELLLDLRAAGLSPRRPDPRALRESRRLPDSRGKFCAMDGAHGERADGCAFLLRPAGGDLYDDLLSL